MNKKYFISISIFLTTLLFLFNCINSNGQTRRITYDWLTKSINGNKTLPFDQPFEINIEHLDANILSLKLIIKEGNSSICTSPVDSICFDQLRTVNELSFSQNKLQGTIIKENLKPNKDYYLGFRIQNKSQLSSEALKKLTDHLQNSQDFLKEVNAAIYAVPFSKLNISTFNSIIYKHIQNHNGAYQVDTTAITNEKTAEAQFQIRQASLGITGAEFKIDKFIKILKDTFNLKQIQLLPISSIINFSGPDCCQLKPEFSLASFFEEVEKIRIVLIKERPADSVKINEEFIDANDGIGAEFQTRDDAIKTWLVGSLVKVTLEKTYLLITLGTTTIDPVSTDASPYISQSFGYGFSPRTAKGLFYFSYSIFFRPVNLSVPLNYYRGIDYFATRFCANLGFTMENVETNKSGKISGLGSLFGNKAGLVGLGYRPLPFLKIDFNYMLYYMNDPNPLLNQKRFTSSPLLGVSVNLNIIKLFAGQPNSLSSLQTFANNE